MAICFSAHAQTVSYNFNTPGYIGSTLLLWNNSGSSTSAYSESTNGGVGTPSSGAVAVAPASAGYQDSTLLDQTVFDFASASAGSYYTERIDFELGSAASGGQPQKVAQLGFINGNNTGFLGTPEANPGQTAPSFVSLRLCSANTNTPTTYYVETQIKLSTDSGATSANSSSSFILSTGTWYRFSAFITNNGSGSFTLAGLVDNLGTNGLQTPATVFASAPATVTNAELAGDSTVYGGFRSTSGTGLSYLDNFNVAAFPAASNPPPLTITNPAGLSVAVFSNGTYTISFSAPAWTFGGNLAQPLNNLAANSGTDNLGAYSEITLGYTASVGHAAGIRLYQTQPVVVFSDTTLAVTTNDLAFPHLTNYPANLYHISFGNTFGLYNFTTLFNDSPWLFFDTNFNSFVLSPATNYMVAYDVRNGDGSISCGINPAITQLPTNFTHRTILVAQNGIHRAYTTWGAALTARAGKIRPANDAAVELNKLGYWTDNGATYYYNTNAPLGIENTLFSVRDEYASKGVPLAYVQLDSWWYPKGASATWQGDPTNNRGGIYLYQPATPLFPDGLSNFQQNLNLPLIVHARWIDNNSPYRTNYAMSGGVCVDPAYWTNRMSYLKSCGVITFEQDWLSYMGVPNMNLNDPPNFMNYMQAAAATNGLNLQYCMMWARHALQGTLYNNLMTIRTSQDDFTTNRWTEFLYGSQFTGALGEWPWCDVFMSSETRNLLLATLSAGPVGPGDALGAVNATNLLKAVRPDSVIVKPDTSLVPTDQSCVDDALGRNLPMVATAYTDHDDLRALYVYSYARTSGNRAASFTPAQLGVSGNAFVYNYFTGAGTVVSNGNAFNFTADMPDNTNGGSYYIAVPIGPSGIAFLGDTNKFVTLGKKRVAELSDPGFVHATVVFAPGETNLTLTGYAPGTPYVTALNGSVGTVNYDSASHYFAVPVLPGSTNAATAVLGLVPVPTLQITNLAGQLQISWPAAALGFILQKATTLSPPQDWTPVTNAVVPIGDQNTVVVPVTGSTIFYRLKQ